MINNQFFKIKNSFLTLKDLIDISGAALDSVNDVDLTRKIYGVSTLAKANAGEVCFLGSAKYLKDLQSSNAGFCFIEEKNSPKVPEGMIALIHRNPYFAFSQILQAFYSDEKVEHGQQIAADCKIEKSAVIGKNARIMSGAYIGFNVEIGENCYIGPNAVIEDNCKIGNNAKIHSQSFISYAIIGDNAIIHSGVRIGQDGFGFVHEAGNNHKILQLGIVRIGNDVEIGSNSCVDRGALEDTIIGNGVKIDNLVQIGHNVKIGDGTVMCGCSGVAGSTEIGKFVQVGARAGIVGHIKIGDGAKIAGMSGVARSVEPMQAVGGVPAVPLKDWHRMSIRLARLSKEAK